MSEQNSGEIPANVMADPKPAENTPAAAAKPASTPAKKAPAAKPAAKKAAAKKAPAKAAAKPAAKPAAKETHIADKIKALPRRRVWPD